MYGFVTVRRLMILMCLIAACAGVSYAQEMLPDAPAQALWKAAPPLLDTEPVGIAGRQSWVTPTHIFKNPKTGHWVQMLVKKSSRDAREFLVTTLDLNTGAAKEHDVIKGYGQSKTAWAKGKLYFTTWLPGGFHVYDPATDTITQLEQPFNHPQGGAFRMSVSPDGVLSMGEGGACEVSTYDPATGTLTRYGVVGNPGHGYVYEMGSDNDYVYAALRGKAPWELVVINKKTKVARIALTVPAKGYMNIGDGGGLIYTEFPNKATAKQYKFVDGNVIEGTPEPRPKKAPGEPAPKVLLDESPLFEGKDALAVHYQDPGDRKQWKVANVEAPLASERTLALTALDDGRIAAIGGPYNPIVLFDPTTGEGRQVPFAHVSGRCLLAVDKTIYGTGYPGVNLVKWDTARPATLSKDLPGKPGVPITDPKSNPRQVANWAQAPRSGGHIGARMFLGPDGCIYICAKRHRHNLGFDIVWYDPIKDEKGEIEDNGRNDHLACTWACLVDGGKRLLVSTTVEPNRQLTSPVPDEAKLILIDLEKRTYIDEFVPFKGVKALTGIVEVAPNKIVGLAPAQDLRSTYIYRYDIASRRVEKVVRCNGLMLGQHGIQALPARGLDFAMGPDGMIWTGQDVDTETAAVLRIAPEDLGVAVAGRLAGRQFRYAFAGKEVYVNGDVKVRRVPALSAFLKAEVAGE